MLQLQNSVTNVDNYKETLKYIHSLAKLLCIHSVFHGGNFLALYLQHLGNSTGSRAAVKEAVHAFAWIYQAAELPYPTNDSFVKAVLGGLCRIMALPTVKKTENIYQ